MPRTKFKSRLLAEVHEMATGLSKHGMIDKRRMGDFDALCKLTLTEMAPKRIKALRIESNLSQAVFAAVLNTSVSTVQKWEIGDKKPSGPSLKLLDLIARKGIDVVL